MPTFYFLYNSKMRVCSNCKCKKSLEEFPNDKARPLGKAHRCKSCKRNDDERDRLKRDYNLTQEELSSLCKSQNNACKICNRSFDNCLRAIDHDHITGRVRGLLCSECNTGLGKFKDNPDLLKKAFDYLSSDS